MGNEFHLTYETEVTADDAEDAAQTAWKLLRAPDAIPPMFEVVEQGSTDAVQVDLWHGTVIPAGSAQKDTGAADSGEQPPAPSLADAAAAVHALKEQVFHAPDMPDALRLLASAAGEDGVLEQVVFLLLAAREQVNPYADFENRAGSEWELHRALGDMADDLRDSLREIVQRLTALGVMGPQGNTAGPTTARS